MKRRDFIRGSSAIVTLPFWLQGCHSLFGRSYPIHIHSDYSVGHMMMESQNWKEENAEEISTVIVGGGLAGMAAAWKLRDQEDFLLFELSDRLGGTSAAQDFEGMKFSQGAHYELAYPEYFGPEVLEMLQSLDIIRHESWRKLWSFVDTEHVIPYERRQQCYENGKIRQDVIPEGGEKRVFYDIISPFLGKMPLPTRLTSESEKYLNNLTFLDFLTDKMDVSSNMKRRLDYHMMDDWGGTSDQVSALAGISYFMCRPYYVQSVDLFSPPSGNDYFTSKINNVIPGERIYRNHLAWKIEKERDLFVLKILDAPNRKIKKVKAKNVIYAGQKHALKYVYPSESGLFEFDQAPWMVLNYICEDPTVEYGYWQNEFLGEDPAFLGFIDSSVQDKSTQQGKRIFTAYYCLKPSDHEYLVTIPKFKEEIASTAQGYIEEMLGKKIEPQACFINVMGHAMAIPRPGFLFNDANDNDPDLIYAGVDNGRLPLLFEALDSGLMATNLVLNT